MDLKDYIRGIPDFPVEGVLFYDISTLLADADAWQVTMGRLAKEISGHQPDLLAGIESRGFLVAGLRCTGLDGSQGVRMEFAPPPPSSSGRSLVSLVPKTSGRSDKVRGTGFQSWSNRYG